MGLCVCVRACLSVCVCALAREGVCLGYVSGAVFRRFFAVAGPRRRQVPAQCRAMPGTAGRDGPPLD